MAIETTDVTGLEKGKKLALVIGVNHAPSSLLPSLHYANTDAEAMANTLEKYCHFELLEPPLLNEAATSDSVKKAVRRLARNSTDDDFLLLYFSGHGQPLTIEADRQDVYLVTHDFAAIDVEEDEEAHVSMRWLRDKLYLPTYAGKVLLILDCCYAGNIGRTAPDPYLEELKQRINFYFGAPGKESGAKSGGLRLALTATGHDAIAKEAAGSGVMTGLLLPALRGEIDEVLDASGMVSLEFLHRYLQCAMPLDQQPSLSGDFAGRSCILAVHHNQVERSNLRLLQNINHVEKVERVHAMLADHSGFMWDRLESFVGRQMELAEIKQRITEKMATGGYVTITGQAGQGKSSIIAKLVQIYDLENVAFHFIPFNPGPDHQVSLLRNLMARLILKYDLSSLYVASESRPALRDYFPKVLRELVDKGGQEVIFVDGLDQIEEELSGVRDLSFLPNNPPPGVVFVLGTRPNDTLRPLELLKPHHEYKLPNLSRTDFDLILSHRNVRLKKDLTDRFYKAMQENALYLDLVAKELAETDVTHPVEVIKRVADNPDNIFSLSIDRFKRQERQWRTILKPILGLLLASREPLRVKHIRQILNIDDDETRDGLRRLGGLVSEDGQGRRYLFHLKLQDYLRQDEDNPHKEYIFATDEEMLWHKKVVSWCEISSIEDIWRDALWDKDEQARRVYARQHYITHLYLAKEWTQMWSILDKGEYGREKVRYDPSMRFYAQDLDLGCQAAIWSGWSSEQAMALLPRLWKYTLLRSSLTSRADSYSIEVFEALLACRREKEALGLAELLTSNRYKIKILIKIADHIGKVPIRRQESLQILMRTYEIAKQMEDAEEKFIALEEIGRKMVQVQQEAKAVDVWLEAKQSACSINNVKVKSETLRKLSQTLVLERQWQQATLVVRSIDDPVEKENALRNLKTVFMREKQWKLAEGIVRALANWRERAENLRRLAQALILEQIWEKAVSVSSSINAKDLRLEALGELNHALVQAKQLELAVKVAQSIAYPLGRAMALQEVGAALLHDQQEEQATAIWVEALKGISSINLTTSVVEKLQEMGLTTSVVEILQDFGKMLLQRQDFERVLAISHSIEDIKGRVVALQILGIVSLHMKQEKQAVAVWTEALELILTISIKTHKMELLLHFNEMSVQECQWKLAIDAAISIDDTQARMKALRRVGMALLQSKEEKQAVAVWTKILQITDSLYSSKEQVESMQEIGTAFLQAEEEKQATAVWTKALQITRRIWPRKLEMLQDLGEFFIRERQWKFAIDTANSNDDIKQQLIALRRVGVALLQAEEEEQAVAVWTKALQIAHSFDNSREQVEILRDLVNIMKQRQDWEWVIAMSRSIKDHRERVTALTEVGIAIAQDHQEAKASTLWMEAIEIAKSLQTQDQRTSALCELSKALSLYQKFNHAEAALNDATTLPDTIASKEQRAIALCELSRALAQTQQWNRAEEVIQSITVQEQKTIALCELSKALAQTQQWNRAEEVIQSITVQEQKTIALCELSKALVQAQCLEEAKLKWIEIKATLYLEEESSERAKILYSFCKIWTQKQQWKLALEVTYSIGTKDLRAQALLELGEEQEQKQLHQQAIALWSEAEMEIGDISSLIHKANILSKMGLLLKRMRQENWAKEAWSQAKLTATSIKEKDQRVLALCILCNSLDQGWRPEQASEVWTEAEEIIRSIKVKDQKARALCAVGKALILKKQRKQALEVWSEAEEVIRSIEAKDQKARALYELSCVLAQDHQWERATQVANSIEVRDLRASALRELGEFLAESDENERLLYLVQNSWVQADIGEYALKLLPQANRLIRLNPEIGMGFYEAFTWVDTFLRG